jgi:hypothetical protein
LLRILVGKTAAPSDNGGVRAALFLLLLQIPSALAAADDCDAKFGVLGRAARWIGRGIIRNATPPEEMAKRSSQFWVERGPGELSFSEKVINSARARLGKPPLPAPPAEQARHRFDPYGGIHEYLNRPVRKASGALVARGLLKEEKELGPLALLALTAPFDAYPYMAAEDWAADQHRDFLLKADFRFHDLQDKRDTFEKRQNELLKKMMSLPPGQRQPLVDRLQKLKTEFDESLKEDVDQLEKWHSETEEIENRYARFKTGFQSETEKQKFTLGRCRELLRTPLYADIAAKFKVDSENFQDSRFLPQIQTLITNRELLFYRYHLIPKVIHGGKELADLIARRPVARADIEEIQASPVYAAARKAYQEGRISFGYFQRVLMEDSYWELERFERWNALGLQPSVDPKTGKRITPEFIRQDMVTDIEAR